MPERLHAWENLLGDNDVGVRRMRVPGGWLYSQTNRPMNQQSLVFVPEPAVKVGPVVSAGPLGSVRVHPRREIAR